MASLIGEVRNPGGARRGPLKNSVRIPRQQLLNASRHRRLHRRGRPARDGACGSWNVLSCWLELGLKLKLEVFTDNTAKIGMHSRIGSARVRHLEVTWLWTNEAVQAGRFSLKQVGTTENVSDVTTKYHNEESMEGRRGL